MPVEINRRRNSKAEAYGQKREYEDRQRHHVDTAICPKSTQLEPVEMTDILDNATRHRTEWMGALMPMSKLTPEMATFLMDAWCQRERRGAEWCRKKKMGPLRTMARTPPMVVDLCGSPPTLTVLQSCREIYAVHCRACGACELKDEAP